MLKWHYCVATIGGMHQARVMGKGLPSFSSVAVSYAEGSGTGTVKREEVGVKDGRRKRRRKKLKQANSRKNAGAGEGGINNRWCVWEVRGFVEWDDGHFFFPLPLNLHESPLLLLSCLGALLLGGLGFLWFRLRRKWNQGAGW